MEKHILTELTKLNINITSREIKGIQSLVSRFEVYDTHVMALSSPTIGVYPIYFKDNDRADFFDLFSVKENNLKKIIQDIPTINNSFIVSSDAFNILSIWLICLSNKLIKDNKSKHLFQINVLKYLHYKFFTSLSGNFMPHPPNEEIMLATISGMSKKFDIVIFKSWAKVIRARSENVISPESIHYNTLLNGVPDDKFIYIITDLQSRLRDRVKNVVSEFHKARNSGKAIKNKSATITVDGSKILMQPSSVIDGVSEKIAMEVLNMRTFIEPRMIRVISKQYSSVSISSIDQTLRRISAMASEQQLDRKLSTPLIKHKDRADTVGIKILIHDIINSSYRYCHTHKTDVTDNAKAYLKIKDAFSSSRISDEQINSVKARLVILINDIVDTKREATKASLRLAIILYIVYKSFKYLKS